MLPQDDRYKQVLVIEFAVRWYGCESEPPPQVSTQLSVLVARIARLDCPDRWPELLPFLTEVSGCGYSLVKVLPLPW